MPELSIPKEYKDGDILFAADLDAICDAVESFLNGNNLDSTNVQTSITGALSFTGMIAWYGNSTPPSGWLVCDGSAVSQSTYAALFNIIGTTFGPTSGGNFTLPDFRRYAPMGVGGSQVSGPANTMGSTGGEETHTLSSAEIPAHTHTEVGAGHLHNQVTRGLTPSTGSLTILANFDHQTGFSTVQTNTPTAITKVPTTTSTGGGGSHNNVQPSLVSNFIIKT